MTQKIRHAVGPAFLFACLLLGGSPQGVWRYFVLQLIGLGLVGWALFTKRRAHPTPAAKTVGILILCWLALLLLQLVPLPPSVWTALPGREVVAESFTLRGEPLPWLSWSLAPAETAAVLPMIGVSAGILAAMVWLGAYRSRWCIGALVVATIVSVLLGALQLAQGGPYLYPIYNLGGATGLFANSNHQGTLLLASIPFLAATIARERGQHRTHSSAAIGRMLIAGGALAVVVVGVVLNRSLAALLLVVPVVLASAAIALPSLRKGRGALAAVAVLLLLAGTAAIAWRSGAGSEDTSIASRAEIYAHTATAIRDTFPVGTGVGSFEPFYRLYEDPASVNRYFVNHAHSDPLEWILETGLAGSVLLLVFIAWWARQAVRVWRTPSADAVVLAATISSAAILAHSLVDYPLRGLAIQAVFAMCLAFMVDARSRSGGSDDPARQPRHLGIDDDPALNGSRRRRSGGRARS